MSLRGAWMLSLGVVWVALGASLLPQTEVYNSTSYVWIFYYVPPEVWGLLFLAAGAFSVSVSHATSPDLTRVQIAFAINSGIAFTWFGGFVAALYTQDLRGFSSVILWAMVAFWNALVARSYDDSKARM